MSRFAMAIPMLTTVMLSLTPAVAALAQDKADAPRFLIASASKLVPLDVDRSPILGRRLVLDLNNATLSEALTEITAQSGLRFSYSDDVQPQATPAAASRWDHGGRGSDRFAVWHERGCGIQW